MGARGAAARPPARRPQGPPLRGMAHKSVLAARRPARLVKQPTILDRHCEERKRRSDPVLAEQLDCFASLAMTKNKEAERRQTHCNNPAPAGAGRATERAACAALPLSGALACRRSTTALPKGCCRPLVRSGPGFVGKPVQGAGVTPPTAKPTSSDAPRMPVVMPAGMMPGPPGSGVQARPRAPSSPRPPDMPPGGVLAGENDSSPNITKRGTSVKSRSLSR